MSSPQPIGVVTTIITAGPIKATGTEGMTGHQLRMDDGTFLHITPELAAQWIDVLTPIAKEAQ